MTRDLEALYRDVPAPKDVWITERESHVGRAIPPADQSWDDFLARNPAGHILQTSRWAELKASFGWTAQRAVLRTIPSPDAPILGGASILFRRLPWGQTLAYVPRGPVVDWSDPEQVRAVLTMAREFSRKARAALIKIEPELPASAELAAQLAGYGFQPSPQRVQPLSTIHVDLAGDEEAILAAMKPKWRYNIRLAERKGVVVRAGNAQDLPAIQRLFDVTAARDGFGVHSAAYYARATELFAAGDAPGAGLTWLVAEHAGRMLGAIAVFALSRMAWYMWGASSDEDRNLMPNHALQWAAMKWARARGCAVYDLWGIPDEVGADPAAYAEPESWGEGGLWGVYRFKQGFGGRVVRYTGAWDLPLSRSGYALYRLALRVRARRGGQEGG
ncbi:MAG: Lipid II:glycine glycyltransferase [Chloroflexi bacterium ADurb.Bin325]|nr:MAG: Lipid II:glycine glycyltransferase [Chloroflexi bacterium ADurb.Bin325]